MNGLRRGARRPADVPPEILLLLEAGGESVNHMEQMAIDSGSLLAAVMPSAAERADELRCRRFLDRLRAGARIAWDLHGEDVFDVASEWESDTARGWAAFAVPFASGGLPRQLGLAMRFADDPHFAVREWAWLGVRPSVVSDPLRSVAILSEHTADESPRIRRFCSEVTRPRGVWSQHIQHLKDQPEAGLPILDPLATAPERYVQDSVANWLNDVARLKPGWVRDLCNVWLDRHGDTCAYIRRRACRSIRDDGAGCGPPRLAPAPSTFESPRPRGQ